MPRSSCLGSSKSKKAAPKASPKPKSPPAKKRASPRTKKATPPKTVECLVQLGKSDKPVPVQLMLDDNVIELIKQFLVQDPTGQSDLVLDVSEPPKLDSSTNSTPPASQTSA